VRHQANEWDIERLDLDAYLRRVAYDGDTAPTVRTLAALHRAHLAAIPFANVDVVLGRGIAVDIESVQGKLVVVRKDEEKIESLIERRLTVARPDGTEDERDVASDELADLLRGMFGIPLNDDEVTQLTFASRTPG
jgi:arylamine N-acetyltransferase